MSDWEPATEAEAAMREALVTSDQEHYFRILARSELLLPVSAEALAGRVPMGWGTWTTGNRTHVLAFTSPAALFACLNEPGGSYRTAPFPRLAQDWPNYEWWLAVNPGLPIEAYLPSWFVAQLTRGDVRLPGRTMGARGRMAQSDLAAALGGRVRASASAGAPQAQARPRFSRPPGSGFDGFSAHNGVADVAETVEAEIIDYPPASGSARVSPPGHGSPGSSPGPQDAGVAAYGAAGHAAPGYGAPGYEAPGYAAPGYGAPGYVVAEHGAGGYGATAGHGAADHTATDHGAEHGVAGYGTARGTAGFGVGGSGAPGPAPGRPSMPDVSPAASGSASPGGGPGAGQIFASPGRATPWAPPPTATPGHPAEPVRPTGPARGTASARPGAGEAEDAEIVSPQVWDSGFAPANETESNLLSAAAGNDTDAFLSTLLLARVILPVPPGTPPSARPRERDFPWQIEEADGRRFIAVFTSPERLSEHRHSRLGSAVASVSLRFVQLIGAWPDAEVAFAINPGSPVGATLPGSQIVALASWAAEVGLRDDPAAEVVVAPKKNESKPVMGVAGAPTATPDRATVMQRTVPMSQLSFYLERGYDRVSGFVNRASEVAHLTAPKTLYRALGLVYPGSPFSEDDEEAYVVRWVAHRTDLYRIPYGGQHEAAMRAMQGWVIERPPFRGNSFAPGDTDVVAEFKVDSVRLPHGAQMWRLSKDAIETLVATFDADSSTWVPAAVAAFGLKGGSRA